MGKILVIILILVAAIIAVILLSVQEQVEDVPEVTSQNLAQIQAKSLCNNALIYGIKQIEEGNITFTNDEFSQVFTNFDVMEGTIDSIQYVANASADTIEIASYVHYNMGDEETYHKSNAKITYAPSEVQSAIAANGDITVKGNAEINGDIEQNSDPPLDFEGVFGVTKDSMRTLATNLYIDPPNNPSPVDSITWVEFTSEDGMFRASSTNWSGSGLLIIDGDATFSGGNFYGIIWITGTLFISGNLNLEGALYAEGGTTIEETMIIGTAVINYNVNAISDAFGDNGLTLEMELKIISWHDE